jgi:hypothetical protein
LVPFFPAPWFIETLILPVESTDAKVAGKDKLSVGSGFRKPVLHQKITASAYF